MTGIPTECVICDAELLSSHQLDGLCGECKLVLRNARGTSQTDLICESHRVTEALHHRCGLCGARPGEPCRNTVQPGQPIPGRTVHLYRLTTTEGEPR
jgi:hypothetical protein